MVESGLRILDVMTLKPVIASPNMCIRDVAALMEKFSVGSVIVKDGNSVVGIVTELDFVRRAILEGMDTLKTPISEIMTRDLVIVSPDTDIMDAINLMKDSEVRHLPVLDGNKMVGFVTVKDILRVQPNLFDNYSDSIRLREEHRKPLLGPVLSENFLNDENEY